MYQDPEAFEREYAAAEPKVVLQTKRPPKAEMDGEEDEDGDFTSVGKGGKALGFTPDSVFKNLQAVQESRGKKVILPVSFAIPLVDFSRRHFSEHRPGSPNSHSRKIARGRNHVLSAHSRATSSHLLSI